MSMNGEGMPKNPMAAYFWFSLAIADGHQDFVENRKMVESEMTQKQIFDAKKAVDFWLSAYSPKERNPSLFSSIKSWFH